MTPEEAGDFYASVELLTDRHVARLLCVHVDTARRWRREGVGPPAVRLGRWIRYVRSDVEAWIRNLPIAQRKGVVS
jgi:excisionase family DNA binding protein